MTGRSVAWLARLLWEQEVPSSNLGAPTFGIKEIHGFWHTCPYRKLRPHRKHCSYRIPATSFGGHDTSDLLPDGRAVLSVFAPNPEIVLSLLRAFADSPGAGEGFPTDESSSAPRNWACCGTATSRRGTPSLRTPRRLNRQTDRDRTQSTYTKFCQYPAESPNRISV